jgi:hypothetical protein
MMMVLFLLIRFSYLEVHNVKETKTKSSVNQKLPYLDEFLLELPVVRIE